MSESSNASSGLGLWNPQPESRQKDIVATRHLITIDNISNTTSVSKPSDQCSDHDKDNNLNGSGLHKHVAPIAFDAIEQTF